METAGDVLRKLEGDKNGSHLDLEGLVGQLWTVWALMALEGVWVNHREADRAESRVTGSDLRAGRVETGACGPEEQPGSPRAAGAARGGWASRGVADKTHALGLESLSGPTPCQLCRSRPSQLRAGSRLQVHSKLSPPWNRVWKKFLKTNPSFFFCCRGYA